MKNPVADGIRPGVGPAIFYQPVSVIYGVRIELTRLAEAVQPGEVLARI